MIYKRRPLIQMSIGLLTLGSSAVLGAYFARRPTQYPLLDSHLGASAWQPTKLLEVLSWLYHDNNQNPFGLGFPEFFDFQHQALLRLLDIQQSCFGHRAPPCDQQGTGIDHSFAHTEKRTKSRIIVIGTGTLNPCYYDDSPASGSIPYWQMERFTFTSTGELLSREAHTTN